MAQIPAFPNLIDLERLIRIFRDTYSHAMTLEAMLLLPESDKTEHTYSQLRKQNDKKAEQEFDLLFRVLYDPKGFANAVTAFESTHPKTGRIQ
jgi:hypothetical protein